MMNKYLKKAIRVAAILTTSYVAGTIIKDVHEMNQLIINWGFTKGSLTSAELKIEFTDVLVYALAYDAQSAAFTVGSRLYNKNKTASGIITVDADGGTTGTLTLNNVIGTFTDNEAIFDEAGGAAIVNGTLTEASTWYQKSSIAVSGGTGTVSLLEYTQAATGNYRIECPIKDRHVRISVKGTGTTTSSSSTIEAVVGTV